MSEGDTAIWNPRPKHEIVESMVMETILLSNIWNLLLIGPEDYKNHANELTEQKIGESIESGEFYWMFKQVYVRWH